MFRPFDKQQSSSPTAAASDDAAVSSAPTGAPTIGTLYPVISDDDGDDDASGIREGGYGEGLWKWWIQLGGDEDEHGQTLSQAVGDSVRGNALYVAGTQNNNLALDDGSSFRAACEIPTCRTIDLGRW